jgi:hypothetical protein
MKQDERKPTFKPTIKNEIDPEDWKNHTVNLIEELDDEQIGNAVLLSYIGGKIKGLDQCENWNSHGISDQGK